jgi:alkylation response protein AidB-like acyl-CoA dehydrogenase
MPEGRLEMRDLDLPGDALLADENGQPYNFKALMSAYNSQRVGAAAVALGLAQAAFEAATAFTKERRQFDRPVAEFQGVQWMLADMAIEIEAARALLHKAAASDVNGFPDPILAAKAKIKASEVAVTVTNNALQLHGARGYSRQCPVERMVRDARMFTIGGGTAQILRNLVASDILGCKLPQTRDGYQAMAEAGSRYALAAE